MKGVTVPVHGLEGLVTGLASCALAPWTVLGLVDESAVVVTRHAPLLSVCGLSGPGLLATTGTVRCACALGVTVRGHDDCACDGSRYRS